MKNNVKHIFENQKAQEIKERIKLKLKDGKDWVIDNKEIVVTVTPVVIGGIAKITKMANKHISINGTKKLKELYCYDRSLGHYWSLRRKLTNKEWVEIDKRKNNGERLSDILAELKVLK